MNIGFDLRIEGLFFFLLSLIYIVDGLINNEPFRLLVGFVFMAMSLYRILTTGNILFNYLK